MTKNVNIQTKTIESEQIIFVDCDDTLVLWSEYETDDHLVISNPYDDTEAHTLGIHRGHIKILKDRHARGAFIVVWSAGGYRWAEAVVKALKLENHVDMIMSKPYAHIDDKPSTEWMGERIYLSPDSRYGK